MRIVHQSIIFLYKSISRIKLDLIQVWAGLFFFSFALEVNLTKLV